MKLRFSVVLSFIVAVTVGISFIAIAAPTDDGDWFRKVKIPPSHPGANFPQKEGLSIRYWCGAKRCTLDDYVQRSQLCALVVLKAGKALHYQTARDNEECAKAVDPNRYNLASVTKSITSLLFAVLLKEGEKFPLGLDSPVATVLPKEIKGYPSNISVRQLLHMSSGMEWREEPEASDLFRILKPDGSHQGHYKTLVDAVNGRLSQPAKFPGPRSFAYSGFDAELIALVVQAALPAEHGEHVTLASAFQKLIWSQLETGQTAEWNADTIGDVPGICCAYASAHDIAILGDWIMQQFRSGKGVVSSWLRHSLADTVNTTMRCQGFFGPRFKYGYLWWIPPEATQNEFTAIGRNGQFVHLFPDQNVLVVQLGQRDTDWCEAMQVHRALADAASAHR